MSQVSKEIESKLEDLITTINTALDENNTRTHEIDLQLVDLYHFIEFHPNLDAASGYSAYKRLSKVLNERREVKDNLAALSQVKREPLLTMFAALKANDLDEETRSYKARTGEYENIPGVRYTAEGANVTKSSVKAEETIPEVKEVIPEVKEAKCITTKVEEEKLVVNPLAALYPGYMAIHPGKNPNGPKTIIARHDRLKTLYDFADMDEAIVWLRKACGSSQAKSETLEKHITRACLTGTKYNNYHWFRA